jgi:hypothetical protein
MNDELIKFARDYLKENLKKCTEAQRGMFNRMYQGEGVPGDVDSVVDAMPESKLDWAMEQVRQTLQKNDISG